MVGSIEEEAEALWAAVERPRGRRGRPKRGNGTPGEMRAVALTLLWRCHSQSDPPPKVLIEVFEALLAADPQVVPKYGPDVPRRQRIALEREFESCNLQDLQSPFKAPRSSVAAAAGVSVGTVSTWRRDPAYRRGLALVAIDHYSNTIDRKLTRETKEAPEVTRRKVAAAEWDALTDHARRAHLDKYLRDNEEGASYPVRSPHDGQLYPDRDRYIEHLIAAGLMPHGWGPKGVRLKSN